jgi:hypothetical protein
MKGVGVELHRMRYVPDCRQYLKEESLENKRFWTRPRCSYWRTKSNRNLLLARVI